MGRFSIVSFALMSCLLLALPVRAEVMKTLSPTILTILEENSLGLSVDQKKALLETAELSPLQAAINNLDRRILKGEANTNDYLLEMDGYDAVLLRKLGEELDQEQFTALSAQIWQEIGVFSLVSRAYSEAALGKAIKTREYHKMRYQTIEGLVKLHKDLALRRFVNAEAKDKYIADELFKIEEYLKATIAKKSYWR